MKFIAKTLFMFVCASCLFTSCGDKSGQTDSVKAAGSGNGTIVDKVIFTVSMDETVALKDVVEGKADVLFTKVSPSILSTLSDTDREKLDIYTIPSGSWSLWLNPIPNKAPYTAKITDGSTVFNPLAIREVRYALNWLISRKKIIDEILLGEGDPMFTPMTPGQPGTYKYNLIPPKLGMTEEGDEKAAITQITEALKKASELPENKGKLVKNGKFWQYNGNDILVKFFMRVDEPTGRLLAGRYIAAQIEKAGIKVERLEWDRSRSSDSVYGANPADYICTMYTEGWGAGATRQWWDVSACQMYAPFYGFMPGASNKNFWNYEHSRLDELGKKGINGQYLEESDYWKGNLEAVEIGLKEAVRIYLCTNNDSFAANKARFNSRMLYGIGDGLNAWSVRSADVKPDTSGPYKGLKVLRVLQHSARGSLFMSAWDPIGKGGFADTYSTVVVGPCSVYGIDESPNTAKDFELACKVNLSSVKTAPKINSDGSMDGNIQVPIEAEEFDTTEKIWKNVPEGRTAAVCSTGKLIDGLYWHHGEPVTIADIRYAAAFEREWITQDGADDKYFDPSLSANMKDDLNTIKGRVFNADGSVTTYKNFFFAPDKIKTALRVGDVTPKAANPGRPTVVPWEIYEAFSEMVVKGAASGTNYNILEGGQGGVEIDVIAPKCVEDVKAKLQEFISEKHIPACLKGFITEDNALKRYKAAIEFIENYGHVYISNGPLMLTEINTTTNSIIGQSFTKYPYKNDFWTKEFSIPMTSIDYVKTVGTPKAGEDMSFEINISEFIYPDNNLEPLAEGSVVLLLQNEDGSETVYTADRKAAGKFTAVIPASDTAKMKTGIPYTVVITAAAGNETPSVKAVKFSIF